MNFKISNPLLKEIDLEIFQFNKVYGMALSSLNSVPNIYASKELISKIDNLLKKLKKVKTKDEFEKLVVENYFKNLIGQKAYLDYFSIAKLENIDSLFLKVLGKDALRIIKKNIADFDYEKLWNYYLAYQEYTYRQIPSDEESLRNVFKKILSDLKKDLMVYAEKHFNFPRDYDFDLVLGQPYSQGTFFHPTNRRMEISPSRFFVFKEDDEIKINVCSVIDALFHELIGHGRQEINSAGLPKGVEDNSINLSVPSLHIQSEGIAQITREYSLDFMRKHKKKYSIEDDFITQIELSFVSDSTANMYSFYQYLQLKKLENSSFNLEKEFKKVVGNNGLFVLYSTSNQSPLSIVRNATYPLGYFYLNSLLENLKKELGDEAFQKNHSLINQLISVGMWHFEVFPKFVRFCLRKKGLLGK